MIRRLLAVTIPILLLAVLVGRAAMPARHPAALGAFGSGPTVVLVHGLGSRPEHWLPMARNLARDHRVVLVELPGHGNADMPHPLTLEGAALSLDRALDEQCSEPAVLVGHSVGGLVAAAEALRSPRRVRALVLVETALRPQLAPDERDGLLKSLERDYRGTLRAAYVPFGRDSIQGTKLFTEAARLDSTMLKEWIRLAVTADLSREIERLRVPLLVVLSDRSWGDAESWDACAKALGYEHAPGVVAVRVEHTGHFIMLDRPARLADLVRRFTRERATTVMAVR
jgi:pimeloyl-ACP methyl ester carboxylesterase